MMRNFLIHNLDYVYLFYGTAFLLLGTASLVFYLREKSKKSPALAWGWLVLFGFLHGANEWFDMAALSCAGSSCWLRERNIILGISFLFLFEFFRRSLYLLKNVRLGFWVYVPFVALAAVFNASCFPCFESSIRYALGLPAALGASYIFWIFSFKRDIKFTNGFCRVVSFLFFLYAFGSGLVVPLSHHWLSRDFAPLYFEDTDYSMKVKKAGYLIGIAKAAYVWHQEHSSFKQAKERQKEIFSKNRETFEKKWGKILRVVWIMSSYQEVLDNLSVGIDRACKRNRRD